LRIANVDAQELGTPQGNTAKAELETILTGKEVYVTTYQTKDKYGRYLADVVLPAATFLEKNSLKGWWVPLQAIKKVDGVGNANNP
jgi:endonuclease YncB( thermonuclease family)